MKKTEGPSPLDLLAEDTISIGEVVNELPGNHSKTTVWRWTTRGLNGVRLESVKIGGRTFTSKQALHRFLLRTQ